MSKKIEVSDVEYAALMMVRSLKGGFASGSFVGVDEASKEGDFSSITVMSPQKLELEKRLERLEKRKEELHHFLQFVDNHDNHDLTLKSYTKQEHLTAGKGVTYESQFSTCGMKNLAEHMMDTLLADIETTKEMLAPILRIEKSLQDKLGGN